jgi:spore cortex biosynthesis protein YabQ
MFGAQGQAQTFLATVYAGLAAGVAYDLLRLLRLSLRAGRWLTALLDLVFWLVAAALVAVAAALSGAEGMRMYPVMGAASGMLLWSAGLRQIIRGIERMTQRMIVKIQAGKRKKDGE